MKLAKDFFSEKAKPSNTRVTRLVEKGEDVHFKSFFNGFYPCIKQDAGKFKAMKDTATTEADLEKMVNKQKQAAK